MLTWVKMTKNVKILNKRAMGRKSAIFAKFWVCTVIIKKNEDYFTFILFCKDSRFAIRMKKFLFCNFDICIPVTPPAGT